MKRPVNTPPIPANTTAAEHVSALITVQAFAGIHAPTGAEPSLEELALLAEGKLDTQLDHRRRAEIFSHLNANPALMADWLALGDALAAPEVQPATPISLWHRLNQWFLTHTAASAWATASVVAIGLLISQWPGNSTPPVTSPYAVEGQHQQPGYATRNTQLVVQDIRAGIATAASGLSTAERNLLQLPDHLLTAGTTRIEDVMAFQLGEQLVQKVRECLTSDGVSAPNPATNDSYSRLEPLLAELVPEAVMQESDPCRRATQQLQILMQPD